jgi:hypothetical protein
MNRTPSRDAGARRASPRKSRPTQPTPPATRAQPVDIPQGSSLKFGAQFIPAAEARQQRPVPPDWQSTGSDLPPGTRRPPNYAIVPPQEPPTQPQSVMQSGSAPFAGAGSFSDQSTLSAAATTGPIRIEIDYPSLLLQAISFEKMARDEIDRLSGANDPDTIESNRKQIDLLTILADGFAKIAAALEEYSKDPQPLFAGKAKEIVDWVGAQVRAWWEADVAEARNLCVRIPMFIASIGALNLAGADKHFATAAIGASIGGEKAIAAIKAAWKRS